MIINALKTVTGLYSGLFESSLFNIMFLEDPL
jgi:hypothetical protein